MKSLACAIITLAFKDLTADPKSVSTQDRDTAYKLLMTENDHLKLLCDIADVNMKAIVERSQKAYTNGEKFKWYGTNSLTTGEYIQPIKSVEFEEVEV
jgi:hypothetical protein